MIRNPKPFNSAYVTPKFWGSAEQKYYAKFTRPLFSPPEYKRKISGLATRDYAQSLHLATNINAAGATKEIIIFTSLCQFVKWSGQCSLCKKTSYPSCVDFQARHGYTIDPYRYKFADASLKCSRN